MGYNGCDLTDPARPMTVQYTTIQRVTVVTRDSNAAIQRLIMPACVTFSLIINFGCLWVAQQYTLVLIHLKY